VKKRLCGLISIVVVLIIVVTTGISFAASPEQQARICAEENLTNYLRMIEPAYQDFHFSSKDQVMKAHLGEPIANFIIEGHNFDAEESLNEQMQPHAFYVFPVMVGDDIITDFTVVLENGQWHPVDIGGRLSKIIDEVSKQNGLSPKDSAVLRFAGETFVIVKEGGKEFGYRPYFDDLEAGLKAKELVAEEDFKQALAVKQKVYLENVKRNMSPGAKPIYGASGESVAIPFKQESIVNRLIRFLRHTL